MTVAEDEALRSPDSSFEQVEVVTGRQRQAVSESAPVIRRARQAAV
jgi:hypothetical protein